MALQKSFENSAGFTGDYWRIEDVHMERRNMQMDVRFGLFKSASDRTAGKSEMGISKNITMPIQLANLINYIYTEAKLRTTSDQASTDTPFFQGATDI